MSICQSKRTNSLSSDNPKAATSLPKVSNRLVCGPYTNNPDASCLRPIGGRPFWQSNKSNNENIVPIVRFVSIFEDPSSGSQASPNEPALSIIIGSDCSSE